MRRLPVVFVRPARLAAEPVTHFPSAVRATVRACSA